MSHYPFIIVGAGPTGLFLGCLLAQKNIPFRILEKRASVSSHSRSIGIHPPSLALFEKAGVIEPFLKGGNKVDTGTAYVGKHQAGLIHFSELQHPFPFILTLSQSETERILQEHLLKCAPECLIRNCEIRRIKDEDSKVTVFTDNGEQFTCDFLIGCDGKNSRVREQAGILCDEKHYSDVYVMGDFEDTIGKRNQAAVHLCKEGLVESFPHGKSLRRWVLKTDTFIPNPTVDFIISETKKRTGNAPNAETNCMLSSFGVQRMIAQTFVKKRIILAGDAAHVVSPIGGQGMNLGWLDVAHLANTLENPNPNSLETYSKVRQKYTKAAANRAAFNMRMGRAFRSETLRMLQVKTMLMKPLRNLLLRRFTMDGLSSTFN